MAHFQAGDVIVVPFPFSDQAVRKVRPAVIVSSLQLEKKNGKYFVAMITSALHAAQHGDVNVSDLQRAGLPAASLVRCSKLATIERSDIHKRVGTLPPSDQSQVQAQLREYMASDAA